ncbi:MAG TPA: alcohol dehydrogenase [Lentisphaeria bacterium]|nr:alcohol dehydrogenase [Lentisphaeria bacterium]|tara:strand:- start:1791 stop:3068 length:1278 start_codon:yes stop_codon:yes gene_type:complete
MQRDTAFQMAASNLRFGPGTTAEVGMDFADMGVKKVLLLTDKKVATLAPVETAKNALNDEGVAFEVFDDVRVEPTDQSFQHAIDVAREGGHDAFLAIGGGSVIDTAKAANLYTTWPADFLTYVNAPIGEGKPVPGPLKPLVAIPTTAGTGSETTGVAIFDMSEIHAKTGIAHRYMKPTLGIVDPENTRTLPPLVAASVGLDVLCHAIESYTALPFDQRPKPERPNMRPAYQGCNPVSDMWSEQAMILVAEYLPRVYKDAGDDEARAQMILASSYAGMGFGNAGVHLCHGMSYPISSMVRDYQPSGYPDDHPIVPHGISVTLNAPAVFRFTAPACPGRHLLAANRLGVDTSNVKEADAGTVLTEKIVELMQSLDLPNGLSAIGFTGDDIQPLVEGTLPQHRVTKLSPRPAEAEDLAQMFEETMTIW